MPNLSRLPVTGADANIWSDILNQYIRVSTDKIGGINQCVVIYIDDSQFQTYINNKYLFWVNNPTSQYINDFPKLNENDFIINRKTSKLYSFVNSVVTEVANIVEGFSCINKFTGSVFRYNSTDLQSEKWLVTSSNNWNNVRDWGAQGDRHGGPQYISPFFHSDDTEAIQATFTYAEKHVKAETYGFTNQFSGVSSTVYFPNGTYSITQSIQINTSLHVIGGGGSSYWGSRIICSVDNTSMFICNGDSTGSCACQFRDLILLKIDQLTTTDTAIIRVADGVRSSTSFYIRDCFFQCSGYGYAINFPQGDDVQIVNCAFDTGHYGIKLGRSSIGYVNSVRIINNTFYAIRLAPITIDSVQGCIISNNSFYSEGRTPDPSQPKTLNCIVINSANPSGSIIISNNTFARPQRAIDIGSVDGLTITNNQIIEAENVAIQFRVPIQLVNIQSNTISCKVNNVSIFVPNNNMTNSIISNNIITSMLGSETNLINIVDSTNSNLISNNILKIIP